MRHRRRGGGVARTHERAGLQFGCKGLEDT